MTIVCATHFTASSSDAVAVAAQLARKTGQPLWLATVLPGLGFTAPGPREREVSDALHRQAVDFRIEGLQVEVAALHGRVERALGRLCTDVKARLLVVGEGRHKTTLLGTPVDRIAHGVSVPLLVVRTRAPFEAWAKGERPLKVLLAIDHTWSSAVAREWLIGLAAYGPLEVVATHVWTPAEEFERRGGVKPMTPADEGSMAEKLVREAEAALRILPSNIKSRVQLELGDGHVGLQLLELASREHVDMLVLGTHPKHGVLSRLTSTSHEVLAAGLMSVALVPGEGSSHEPLGRSSATSPRTMKERARRTT
jgi:nucleotide-binding universal stress UspA family protein